MFLPLTTTDASRELDGNRSLVWSNLANAWKLFLIALPKKNQRERDAVAYFFDPIEFRVLHGTRFERANDVVRKMEEKVFISVSTASRSWQSNSEGLIAARLSPKFNSCSREFPAA